ncbi:hypothetical protein HY450_03230 [Candidatus Pacearchaeota archaeon]|nr:hypothetical protein [Candidatus Pacearchaeota archaeon]
MLERPTCVILEKIEGGYSSSFILYRVLSVVEDLSKADNKPIRILVGAVPPIGPQMSKFNELEKFKSEKIQVQTYLPSHQSRESSLFRHLGYRDYCLENPNEDIYFSDPTQITIP